MRRRGTGHGWRLLFLFGPGLAVVLGAAVMWWLLDEWWPTIPLGYGPRWIWWCAVPVPLLAPRVKAGTRLGTAAVTACLVAFLVFGTRLPVGRLLQGGGADGFPLTVVAFNAAVRGQAAERVARDAERLGADVVAIVECPRAYRMVDLPGYLRSRAAELCLWTRMPLTSPLEVMPRDVDAIGWSGSVLRAGLQVGGTTLPVGFVHLRSVRNELAEFLDLSALPAQADSMARRLEKRVTGSAAASSWLRGASLVVGDFNLVPESPVFRRDWGHYRSAWGVAGLGAGRTWHSRWFGLRIDHVMVGPSVSVRSVRVGDGYDSDHHPVIVELRIRN